MTEVFSHPEELNKFFPEFDFKNINEYFEKEKTFIKKVQEFCKKHGTGKYAGEYFRVPMGDGYAQYVVVSLRPCEVIHIGTGDAWDHPDVSYYPASLIKQKVDSLKALNKMFSK